MISFLRGRIAEKRVDGFVVLDVGGVGYEVAVSNATLSALPADGTEVTLFTRMIVREDAMLLYGFRSGSERETFDQLIRVSGIGAKIAMAVLSGMSPGELAAAVASGDSSRLTGIPGIGKKTAARIVLELKGCLIPQASPAAAFGAGIASDEAVRADVTAALCALGYTEREAAAAARLVPAGATVEEGIKAALKRRS